MSYQAVSPAGCNAEPEAVCQIKMPGGHLTVIAWSEQQAKPISDPVRALLEELAELDSDPSTGLKRLGWREMVVDAGVHAKAEKRIARRARELLATIEAP